MTHQEATQAIDRLEELVRFFGGQWESYHEEVKRIVFKLRHVPVGLNAYDEKLGDVLDLAEIGFSAKKCERYNGGAQQITVTALGALMTVRHLLDKHFGMD